MVTGPYCSGAVASPLPRDAPAVLGAAEKGDVGGGAGAAADGGGGASKGDRGAGLGPTIEVCGGPEKGERGRGGGPAADAG
jgi:hypothetical protein